MKKHKTLIAFIVLALLLLVFLGITFYTSILSYMKISTQAELKVSGMVDTLNRVQTIIDSLEEEFRVRTENSLELMCAALQPLIHDGNFEGADTFEDGVVVKAENGGIVYPDDFSGRFEILKDSSDLDQLEIMTSTTLTDGADHARTVLISSKQMGEDYYYIDWWEMDDYQSSINYEKHIKSAVTTLEQLYEASLLLLEETDGDILILYASEALGEPETIADLGITKKDISDKTVNLTINKKTFSAAYEELRAFDRSAKAVILLNPIDNNSYIINCIVITAGFILICVGAMILWIHWIDVYVKDHELTEMQQNAWQPFQLRKTAASVAMNGAILLFVVLIGYQLLGNMSRISHSNQESLDMMMASLENSSKEIAYAKNEEEDWGVYYARRIADLYSRVPECRNAEFLRKASLLTRSEYIMIFDGRGKELLSSNGYVGFTLGDGVNSNEDLRYLLQGIDHIICEPETEKFSGKKLQMMGARIDLGEKDSYGAAVLVIDPKITWMTTGTKEIENYIDMLTHPENLSIIISKESGKVAYSSDPGLSGKEAAEFGLDDPDMQPISMETFEIQGKKRYGAFNEDDQYRYYYMMDADYIWGDSLKFAVFSAVYYILVCLIVSLIMLGFAPINLNEETARLREKLKQKPALEVDQAMLHSLRDMDNERGNRSMKEWWHDMTPEQKVGQLMRIVLTLLLVILFIVLLSRDELGGHSVINFILHGNWKRGLNELSISAIVCSLVSLLALILVKDLLVSILSSMLNAKGRTVVGLISSLIQYIAIITAIFVSLAYLGFDTSVLITSASILTLAISLGSKDLVADILSGIFIIFEGDFHIGDMIEVNGFKGQVIDIGVRSTKLKNGSNNIKIIDNQSVKNVLNMSKEQSWVFIDLTISNTQPLDEIEAMLVRELPEIGIQLPEILNGPFYFGISEIGYHWIKICIAAVCQQNNVTRLKSELNHCLYDVFKKNGFQL